MIYCVGVHVPWVTFCAAKWKSVKFPIEKSSTTTLPDYGLLKFGINLEPLCFPITL